VIWKHVAANALTVGIVVAACLAGAVQLGRGMWSEPGPLGEATFFEVERGASLSRVADDLEAAGIVSSAPVFRLGASYTDREDGLKFGTYEIPAGATMPEVLSILSEGGPSVFPYTVTYLLRSVGPEYRVRERVPGQSEAVEVATFAPGEAVPEAYEALLAEGVPITWRVAVAPGLTSWEVIEGLRGADFLEGELAEVPPEGMLAPDTYEVERGSSRADLVGRMAQVQERRLAEAWAERQPELPIGSPEEALILASIIEKETGVAEERETVAGVFVNRLRRGMRLQTDPTVIYGITEGRGALGRGIRASELRAPTPWNTYVIDGLPPTPIANPSEASLRAAVDPEETSYVFFVADGTGGHAFAETLDEHNANVAEWRRIEAEREAAQN
jgi:UPF0755 protein